MKNPNLKLKSFLILILAFSLSLIVLSCKDEDPPDNDPPQPHQSTITAFGKTATVTGDASISTADFNTAKGNLEDALTVMDADSNLPPTARTRFTNMMYRTITIVSGSAGPASVNGTLTVGVDYLKSNDTQTIATALVQLVMNGGTFENLTIIDNTNGLAFDGKVTIKTGDPYTVADWNALVANVITAFNAAYESAGNASKNRFRTVFSNAAGAQIVLVNNLANNWEVKDGEFKTLYLKTDSIATAGYGDAIVYMGSGSPQVGKATPPKNRVFLG